MPQHERRVVLVRLERRAVLERHTVRALVACGVVAFRECGCRKVEQKISWLRISLEEMLNHFSWPNQEGAEQDFVNIAAVLKGTSNNPVVYCWAPFTLRRTLPHQSSTREVRVMGGTCSSSGAGGCAAPVPRAAVVAVASREADRPSSPLLGRLVAELGDLLQQEVLRRLGPEDLASLAGAGHGCAAAVAATALMQWAEHAKMEAPGYLPPLSCVTAACSHAARGGHLVGWCRLTA